MTSNQTFISILMPVFNGEKYLKESIQSVLDQTYTNFELICLNDGSTDNSVAIINSFTDSRIKLYHNEVNKGLGYTRNRCIELASGTYLAMLDCDDIALPNRLHIQVSYLDLHPEVGICSGNVISIDEKGIPVSGPWWQPTDVPIEWEIFWSNPVAQPTVMLRKSILIKHNLRYDGRCAPAEDYDLWCKMALLTKMYRLDDILIYYRIHTSSAFHSNMRKAFMQGIVSSQNLAQAITNKKVSHVHRELTIYPEAMGESAIFYRYTEAEKWMKSLLKRAKDYWSWDSGKYEAATEDAKMRLKKYYRKLPQSYKRPSMLKSIKIILHKLNPEFAKNISELRQKYNINI
jgi:glycosyltransferase involved in cell wall biosynthesis